MFPLAVNTLPAASAPAPSVEQSPQTVPSSVQQDNATTARQQLPIAVSSTGAPAAFSPDNLQSRQASEERRLLWHKPRAGETAPTATTPDDAEAPPARPAPVSPIPNFFNPQPIKLGTLLVSQFTAQYIAQEEPAPTNLPQWKTSLPPRKLGVGQAQGAAAYGIAVARVQSKQPATDTTL